MTVPKYFAICAIAALLASATATPSPHTAIALTRPIDDSPVVSPVTRFFFSKQCETVINGETGDEEECCSGNFSCSAAACKGKGVCGGFLGGFFWCSARECKAKNSGLRPTPSASPSKVQDDPLHESGEPIEGNLGDDRSDDSKTPALSVTPRPSMEQSPSSNTVASTSPTQNSAPPTQAPPTPPPFMTGNPDLQCNGNRRHRREIRDLAPWERRRWERAIMELRKRPAPPQDGEARSLSQWDALVKTHQQYGDEAHGGCYFLLWHRVFLLKLENLLRTIEPDIALPYWDWTRDSEDAALSEIWGAEFLGGARKPSQPIQSGAFAWMDAIIPHWHHVSRDFDSGVSGSMPVLWSWSSLNGLVERERFEEFANGLESAHILPHVAVGGDMVSTHHAPNDPVFYLHHAYVDFVYAIRQQRHWRYQFGGTHDFSWGTQQCSADHVFGAFGVPARNAFDIWCVDYIAPVTRGTNTGVVGRTQGIERLRCSNQIFLTNTGMTEKRCKEGVKILESAP